jgi:glycosyltransferase involved in cell wall biosynthesis
MVKVSIIITAFQRADLLKWNFWSLAKQKIPFDFETIVVNDGAMDDTEALCMQYSSQLNLRYIFSGQRNLDGKVQWRVPGFANNIGVKNASGDILVLCCAEMFHLNETISALVQPIMEDSKLLGIPSYGKRDDGTFLKYLIENNGNFNFEMLDVIQDINVLLPFLMALSREQYVAIGGYDEDFTGIALDDDDFVDRLKRNGCRHYNTNAQTIHLFHTRYWNTIGCGPEYHHNYDLWISRKGQIVRNIGREWGKL